jgi:hypothetical protein
MILLLLLLLLLRRRRCRLLRLLLLPVVKAPFADWLGGITILINHFYDIIRCFTKEVINKGTLFLLVILLSLWLNVRTDLVDCFGLFVFEDHKIHNWEETRTTDKRISTFACTKCLFKRMNLQKESFSFFHSFFFLSFV